MTFETEKLIVSCIFDSKLNDNENFSCYGRSESTFSKIFYRYISNCRVQNALRFSKAEFSWKMSRRKSQVSRLMGGKKEKLTSRPSPRYNVIILLAKKMAGFQIALPSLETSREECTPRDKTRKTTSFVVTLNHFRTLCSKSGCIPEHIEFNCRYL